LLVNKLQEFQVAKWRTWVEQMQSKSQINRAFQTELHIPGNSTLCAGDTGQPVSLLFPLGIQASRRPAW
ncbi:MAG: hypothetical protein OXH99_08705, partial [Bryobacterales bacterium]|nr:hypothetical protein [Bryobacterales bacterium]